MDSYDYPTITYLLLVFVPAAISLFAGAARLADSLFRNDYGYHKTMAWGRANDHGAKEAQDEDQ